jgi:hypothetical protein
VSITIDADFIPGDPVAAIVARLRDVTNIMALAGDETVGGRTIKRVGGRFAPVGDPRPWIAVLESGGFPAEMPLARPRISIYAYGKSGLLAASLARLVQAALVPLDRPDTFFVAAGVVVTDVQRATGLIPLTPPKPLDAWHCRVVDYLLLTNEGVRGAA